MDGVGLQDGCDEETKAAYGYRGHPLNEPLAGALKRTVAHSGPNGLS